MARMPGVGKAFALAVLVGAVAVLAVAFMNRPGPGSTDNVKALPGGIWVTGQVDPHQLRTLKRNGFKGIVDLRPDGEAVGQPSSAEMAEQARRLGMAFTYVPVSHGDIPAAAVERLGQALAQADTPVLLYCASGRRASRTWALAEASRAEGMDAAAIAAAVKSVGQPVDDLDAQIAARVAARPQHP